MIKLSVSVCMKDGRAGSFGSRGTECTISEIEIDLGLLAKPEQVAATIRQWYDLTELAAQERLDKLNAKAAAATNGAAAHPTAHVPAPVQAPRNTPAAAAPVNGFAAQPEDDLADEDDDPPASGGQLLGWARKQEADMKGWLIGYGQRRKFAPRIIDWNQNQINEAYAAARKALAAAR